MKTTEMLGKVKKVLGEYRYHDMLPQLFLWDQWLHLPPKGMAYRQEMQGYFAGKVAELFHSEDAKSAAAYFSDFDPADLENDTLRGMVRMFLYRYNNMTKIPVEKQVQIAALASKANTVWKEANVKSDYDLLKPLLAEMFRLKQEAAELYDSNKHPMEILAGMYDEGIVLHEVDTLFDELKTGTVEMLKKIMAKGISVNDEFMETRADSQEFESVVKYFTRKMGYDSDAGGYDEAMQPLSIPIGPRDVRILSSYDNLRLGIFIALHEMGHSIYYQRSSDEMVEHHLWGGIFGGIHESQSRFYEHIIGKSREMWEFFYPKIQKSLPGLQNVNREDFYRGINKVQPSLRRILADELTYSLHPIIRYELEKDIFDGKVNFDNLPEVWNDKYEEYLGIRPQNDREGVLQDGHWTMGMIGYFQSYALGNLYGGQFLNTLLKEVPDVYKRIAEGNFDPLNEWLTDRLYSISNLYSPGETVKRVTGEPLQSKYFLDYLQKKYEGLYGI